ncbi:MAG: carbonic anhydrase [Planctomycetes bacterium]|nr:carbonic anhydrase [Planctomycetota bacterium]
MGFVSRFRTACLLFAAGSLAVGSLSAQRSPDEAMRALQEGNRRFAADRSVPQPLGDGVRRTLARGQSPMAIVLCCADSRVPPEHVFNAGLGELFVVRVAGHTCDPETLASIEYAVEHLNVPLCVVLGHEKCGAVAATVAQVESPGNGTGHDAPSQAVQQLLEQIEPAVRRAKARDFSGTELCAAAEEENVHYTVQECLRRSPLLRRYASVGRFRMVGARYHLASGEVEWLPTRPMPAETNSKTEPAAAAPASVPPHVALRMLQAGHRRFLGAGQAAGDISGKRREELTHGQQPLAIVLTCSDSRVAPEHVFDAGLGELFVIRVAGNTINDDTLASIEYAAGHTGASLLVVMGHSRCGAIQAATEHPEGAELSPNMRSLLARLEPSVARAQVDGEKGADLVTRAVRGNVLRAVAEARSRSPLLQRLETEGRFAILPAVYDLTTGDVAWLKDNASNDTMPAAAPGGETKPTPDRAPSHGSAHGHGAEPEEHGDESAAAHRAPVEHGDDPHGGAHDAHDAVAGHEGNGGHTAGRGAWWLDPRVWLAALGVLSMGAALFLTRKKPA